MALYWKSEPIKWISLGFELEFDTPFGDYVDGIISALRSEFGSDNVRKLEFYTHSDGSQWDVKLDSSAGRVGDYGWEIASPKFPISELYEYLEAVRIIHAHSMDTEIWAGCGFHVHMGLSGISGEVAERFIKFIIYFQLALLTFMPKSRRDNRYAGLNDYDKCIKSFSKYVSFCVKNAETERYRLVNLTMFSRKKNFRVEFRHHSGTREPEKAYLWIRTLLASLHASQNWTPPKNGNGTFAEYHAIIKEVDPFAARWICDRREYFMQIHGRNYGLIDDLCKLSDVDIDYTKFNAKQLMLLILYGKDEPVTASHLNRKVEELSGKKYAKTSLSIYRTQMKAEGLIKADGNNYRLTLGGRITVRSMIPEAF